MLHALYLRISLLRGYFGPLRHFNGEASRRLFFEGTSAAISRRQLLFFAYHMEH